MAETQASKFRRYFKKLDYEPSGSDAPICKCCGSEAPIRHKMAGGFGWMYACCNFRSVIFTQERGK